MSRMALVTTTIQIPTVLEWYRAIAPDVPFFVIGDEQSPHDELSAFCAALGNAEYFSDADQQKLGYASSEALGWRVPGRRSIGALQAARSGAEVIINIDDDNIPLNRDYFADFDRILSKPFAGLRLTSPNGWVDAASLLVPSVHHRGFPHELWHPPAVPSLAHVVGARVGVAAGLWLGDPDIDAATRLVDRPLCLTASPVVEAGFVADAACYSPFNSQNTAFVRELLPLMVMLPMVGRYDDIWASLLAERVMRELGWSVHYGRPFVWQERNAHSAVRDLSAEIHGMRDTIGFARALDDVRITASTVAGAAAEVYEHLAKTAYAVPGLVELGRAWLADVERVL